ncbi:hypothetical protein R3P38DRAFT_2921039 [Favolaschia claudopus]|uniref:Glycosyltransferase 61 catalytic domain-containing protein n=1 Tax=Favolaschia claudopus TaxID=2862362 RepID=A0AAW0C1Q1_9AGAR
MVSREISRRDIVLIFLGATCFYAFSALFSPKSNPMIVKDPDSILAPDITMDLGVQGFPETSVVAHAPGWTLFRNLYMSGGTLLLLTSNSSQFPDHKFMTSTGLPGNLTNDAQRMPTPKEMAFITPNEAKMRWGRQTGISVHERNRVLTVEGLTHISHQVAQDYHFVAELMFGSWLFLSGAFHNQSAIPPTSAFEPSFNGPSLSTSVPFINRAIFIHSDVNGLRDAPGFNGYFLRAVFPSMTVEVSIDWIDRVNATTNTKIDRAWHFPLVLFTDRSAAFRSPICGAYTQRTAAEAWMLMAKAGKIDLIGNWWASIRDTLSRYAGSAPTDDPPSATLPDSQNIIITYINRQGTRRHLRDEDNLALVAAIEQMVERKNRQGTKKWEFNNVHAERITLDEQIRFAAKTTIMLGVHGNGLTHLVFMKPTRFSAVVEIFLPGGFARDYEWTSRSLGMTHYSIWNNESFTHPHEPVLPAYPEGFHGPNIPVQGQFVAKLIEDHVAAKEQAAPAPSLDNSPVYDKFGG